MNFEITTRTKVLIGVLCVVTSFAVGRWSSSNNVDTSSTSKSVTESKTQETINTHTKTTITESKKPDGTDTTTTVIDQVQNEKATESMDSKMMTESTSKPGSKINISVLGANDFSRGLLVPTYGLSVSKEFIGPVTVGAFGLMNGVVGVSIGLDF